MHAYMREAVGMFDGGGGGSIGFILVLKKILSL